MSFETQLFLAICVVLFVLVILVISYLHYPGKQKKRSYSSSCHDYTSDSGASWFIFSDGGSSSGGDGGGSCGGGDGGGGGCD